MLIKRLHKQQGSLLLEVLMAIVILSIGLTFIIQSQSSSLRALNYGSNYSHAAFLIDNKLSEILLNKIIDKNFHDSGNFNSPFQAFHFEISTSPITWPDDETFSETVSQIKLNLTWPNGTKTQDISTTLCLLHATEDNNLKP